MKYLTFRPWILCRLAVITALLLSPLLTPVLVTAQTPPPPDEGVLLSPATGAADPAAPPATQASPGPAAALPNCNLLDDSAARGMMSGALETALLHACGRATRSETGPSTEARSETGLSNETPYSLLPTPHLPTALGDDVLVNDPTGDMTELTQSGAVIARNQDNGILCAAYNDSYHGIVEGSGWVGFSSSGDSGATWSDHGSPGDPNISGYPSLVWRRADGHFYMATLYAGSLHLWHLGANCVTAGSLGMIHSGGSDDKEMLAVDNNPASPYYGRLYVVWTDFTDGHIYATYSDNGGGSWATPVDVSGHDLVNGAWPAVDPVTGAVYVAWTHWDAYPAGPIDVELARSTDGGDTWTPLTNPMDNKTNPRDATASTTCGRPALHGNIRYFPYPQIAVDHNSNLHVVYSYDPDGYGVGDVVNIYYRRSTDGGATWETERRLNDDWTWRDQFSPALAVGETGVVGVFWYDRRLDSANLNYDRYMTLSRDGGVTFEANQRISDASSPVVIDPHLATCYHGDYDGAAAGGGNFYTVWGDDRRGDADVWADSEPYFWSRLFGTVYDMTTWRGIADARVQVFHAFTGIVFTATSEATGDYALRIPSNVTYSVKAQAYGYAPNYVLAVVGQGSTRTDIPLRATNYWDVQGLVRDANTGYPVYAHVTVTGDPFDPPAPDNAVWTDPHTGAYTLHLAGRVAYTLTVTAEGYISQTYATGELTAHLFDINFSLLPDLAACTAPGYEMAPPCQPASGAVLQPARLEVEGCPCADQTHTLYFANHAGADDEVLLTYATSPGATVLDIPASLGVVPDTAVQPFDVHVRIDRGVLYSATVVVTVTASLAGNPAISDTAVIEKRALEPTAWEARADAPSPSMDAAVIEYAGKIYKVGGLNSGGAVDIYDPATDSWTVGAAEPSPIINYPSDACFGYAAPGDPVILLLPDTFSGVTGVWHRYHIASNTWDTPALPAALPANGIWAPDIVVDYRNNMCYITGGATTDGGGDLTTLYRYNPAANTATLLGNFSHIPAGFDFHAGWYVPWIGTSGGVCVGGGVDSSSNVYADTQCYDIAAATFNLPNADLGLLPEPWWGMADMEKVSPGGRQLWLANGLDAGWNFLQRSAYFSQELGKFVYGPRPVYSVYRVEGAAAQDQVYVMGGSAGGFSPTRWNEQLLQCPACDCGAAIAKDASADWAYTGDVVTYTVVITRPNWLTGTTMLVDALPAGVDFAGGLSATFGNAWYSDTTRTVYWTMEPATGSTTPGAVIETFTNTWAINAVGLAYNPETDYVRYVHEGSGPQFTHDVDYPVPHPVLHSFNLGDVNPGWSSWRSGVGYDVAGGHYFLADYSGDGTRSDNIVETDPAGHVLNAWETNGASNDSYDASAIGFIVDVAVVPGEPARYFASALFDGGLVYQLDLIKAGQFVNNSWGTVMTCTVPGIADNAGIDYDAQNGVLYHSSWDNDTVVVTDLSCNALATFTCANGAAGLNSGVTFVEGKWPPEVWVTDYNSQRTTRCQAVGHEPLPEVITVTFNVAVTAPASTTVTNEAVLLDRGAGLSPGAPAVDVRYVAGTWSDQAVHLLDANLNDLGSFPAGATSPNGMATDGETIWSGHYTSQTVVAYDFAGQELYRWSAALSGLQGMEWVDGELAIYQSASIEFHDPRTGALIRAIPGRSNIEGLAFDGTLLWQLDGAWIYGTNPLDGNVVVTITNAALGCPYDGTGIATDVPGVLTLACADGAWYRVSAADGSVIASGNNGLNMYGLAYVPPLRQTASAALHVAPRTALTWTKEVYINGIYMGRYDEGPFTFVPGDDIQLVERLDYIGREPLFVALTSHWYPAPVELVDETHTRGVVTLMDGDWYVTLRPGESERLVKTLRITDTVPVTIWAWLYPDGMPMEERGVAFHPPQFAKNGPAVAYTDQIISYTLTLDTHDPLVGALRLTDTLPAGVVYAGGLNASYGYAWYDWGDGALYWSNTPASALTRRSVAQASSPAGAWSEREQEAGSKMQEAGSGMMSVVGDSPSLLTGPNHPTTQPPNHPAPRSPRHLVPRRPAPPQRGALCPRPMPRRAEPLLHHCRRFRWRPHQPGVAL